uniref:Uncharacterized protein n=1 Tax=Oryza barthii TaxID=65489 RepID=A0A0D3HV94_9ORYZ
MASHRPMMSSSPATSRMTMTTTTSSRALPHNNGSRGCVPPHRPRLAHHCRLSRCLAPPAADPFQHCCRSFCQRPSPRLPRAITACRVPKRRPPPTLSPTMQSLIGVDSATSVSSWAVALAHVIRSWIELQRDLSTCSPRFPDNFQS